MVAIIVAGFALGGSLGGFLSAIVIPLWGWPAVFVVGGLVPLLILLPLGAIWMPESIPYLLKHAGDERLLRVTRRIVPGWRPVEGDRHVGAEERMAAVSALFADSYRAPTILFWITYFANLLLLYILAMWLPTMISYDKISIEAANTITGLYQLSGLFGGIVIGRLADRCAPQFVLAGGFVVGAVALFLVSVSHDSVPAVAVSVFLTGFCVIGGQGALNGFVSTFYPSAIRATGQGWAVGVGRLGSVIGPTTVGWLMAAHMLPPTVFRLSMITSIVAAGAIVWVRRPAATAPAAGVADAPVTVKT
jgi:AAHS family 4-hydroxybenzoate transporter-like MFS transporter